MALRMAPAGEAISAAPSGSQINHRPDSSGAVDVEPKSGWKISVAKVEERPSVFMLTSRQQFGGETQGKLRNRARLELKAIDPGIASRIKFTFRGDNEGRVMQICTNDDESAAGQPLRSAAIELAVVMQMMVDQRRGIETASLQRHSIAIGKVPEAAEEVKESPVSVSAKRGPPFHNWKVKVNEDSNGRRNSYSLKRSIDEPGWEAIRPVAEEFLSHLPQHVSRQITIRPWRQSIEGEPAGPITAVLIRRQAMREGTSVEIDQQMRKLAELLDGKMAPSAAGEGSGA